MKKAAKMSGSREEEEDKVKSFPNSTSFHHNHNSNLTTAATDDNLSQIFRQIKASKSPTVVNYGASWCGVCCQILPVFRRLSSKFPKMWFVYADIDECPETTQHIRYTPTFHFYRDGERVDEMFGGGEERLHDRIWLHS